VVRGGFAGVFARGLAHAGDDVSALQRALLVALLLSALVLTGCKKPYRVGEHVMVEWDGRDYPAYIIEKKGRTRYRVHFDGYDARWDGDVSLDRIKGRVQGHVTPPPPPANVARAAGINPKASSSAEPVSAYKVGDRVHVSWRGSNYKATIIEVISPTRFRVHYNGYETAWDETIDLDRIVGHR
jgi:hypothetical protein